MYILHKLIYLYSTQVGFFYILHKSGCSNSTLVSLFIFYIGRFIYILHRSVYLNSTWVSLSIITWSFGRQWNCDSFPNPDSWISMTLIGATMLKSKQIPIFNSLEWKRQKSRNRLLIYKWLLKKRQRKREFCPKL